MEQNKIRGAIYVPSRAYNAYQMWRDYDGQEIERDLDYAKKLHMNALRIWLSYEYWLEDKEGFQQSFNHFLEASHARGLGILPSLFEKVGVEPTKEALVDQNPLTAFCVYSPSREIFTRPERFAEPAAFVGWIMEHYGSDERLLAIEVMNEPYGSDRLRFARHMLKKAVSMKGKTGLTIGCIDLEHSMYFADIGLDILQHHENFPRSEESLIKRLKLLQEAEEILNKPVWLTEWQRIRPTSSGWGEESLARDEWKPDYVPYAKVLDQYTIGTFFWSLMVKPAYLPPQRKKGTLNGVFHEDGAVWNLEDARAISGDSQFEAKERQEWPDWAKPIQEAYLRGV